MGQSIGESFEEYFAKANRTEMHSATFSVVDMEKFPQVDKTLDYLGRWLGAYLARDMDGSWQKIARAAAETTQYGQSDPRDPPSGLIDLASFSQHLSDQFTDPRMQTAIEGLTQAVDDATVFNVHGKGLPDSNGISIYLPHRRSEYLEETFEEYAKLPLAQRHSWYPFIERATKLARVQKPSPMLSEIQHRSRDEALQLATKVLNPGDFDYAEFALARQVQGKTIILGTTELDPVSWDFIGLNDRGIVASLWEGRWFTLRMGNKTMLCPAVYDDSDADDDAWYLEVTVEMARAGRDNWKDITLEFYYEDGNDARGELDGTYVFKNGGEREINLRAGDRLRPSLMVIDDQGEVSWEPDTRSMITLRDPDDFELTQEVVEQEDYLIGFIAEDVNGNSERQFVEITQ